MRQELDAPSVCVRACVCVRVCLFSSLVVCLLARSFDPLIDRTID